MAGNPATAQHNQPPRPNFWASTSLSALLVGGAAFAVASPYFSTTAAAAASILVTIASVVVAMFGTPLFPALRAAFQPSRIAVMVGLIVVGGVGHAWLFGAHAPAEPKMSPTACDDVDSVAQAPVHRGGAQVAILELLHSRSCRLYWAQVTPTHPLDKSPLQVTVGLARDRGSAENQVTGRLTIQVVWSDPAPDDDDCFAAVVDVGTGPSRFSLATDCV